MNFELRFIVVGFYDVEKGDYGRKEILQMRHKEGPKGEDWWSDWEDVPTDYTVQEYR